jgi:hypothetical protein
VRDQVSHPYKTTGKTTVLYTLILLDGIRVLISLPHYPISLKWAYFKDFSCYSFAVKGKLKHYNCIS